MSASCVCASDVNGTIGVDGPDTNLEVSVDGPDTNLEVGVDGDLDNLEPDVTIVDNLEPDESIVDNCTFDNLKSNEIISDKGTFDDLYNDILDLHSGDVYNINKDYYYDESGLVSIKYGIIINVDNVVINGNGHVIDGMNKSVLFSVYGKNVKIYNLTFVNSRYNTIEMKENGNYGIRTGKSPIFWQGDDGVLSVCKFKDNSAMVMGGVITWMGNNGVI